MARKKSQSQSQIKSEPVSDNTPVNTIQAAIKNEYVILSETDSDICETYYYFLKYNGNEKAIKHLEDTLKPTEDSEIYDDVHVFDIDTEHLVCEQTAFEMCRVELNNSESYHRKFDGELAFINFDIEENDDDTAILCKIHNILSFGNISDFIDDEDESMIVMEEDREMGKLVSDIPSRFKIN